MAINETTRRVVSLQVAADVICPWCYIGKRSLDQAVVVLAGQGIDVVVAWLPYQLNPSMPPEGMDRRAFRTQRFGWEQSLAMDARAVEAGRAVGAAFRYDLQSRTPSTLAAHALVRQAGIEGGATLQGNVVDGLFEAYFLRGVDIGADKELSRIAGAAGMADGAVERARPRQADIAGIERALRGAGVASVPSHFVDGAFLSSGSENVPGYTRLLTEAANRLP